MQGFGFLGLFKKICHLSLFFVGGGGGGSEDHSWEFLFSFLSSEAFKGPSIRRSLPRRRVGLNAGLKALRARWERGCLLRPGT